MDKLIQEYIKNLSINDVKTFAVKNNVFLNDNEINLIYYHITNNWKIILYGNSEEVFNDLKSKLNPTQYNQIESLYKKFKNRYSSFLRR